MSSSLPSAGIRFLISTFLLTSTLQLMASSESIRFTVSRSPDVLRASIPAHPCHFLRFRCRGLATDGSSWGQS